MGLTYAFTTNNLGARGLYVDWSNFKNGNGAVVFATTAQTNNNYLVKIVDNGSDSPINVLAQSGTNQIFRSIRATPIADPGVIVSQPQDQRAALGVKAVFSVTAAGSVPINYQWYKNGILLNDGPSGVGSTIVGAKTSALTIANVVNGDVASYSVVLERRRRSDQFERDAFSHRRRRLSTTQPALGSSPRQPGLLAHRQRS